MKKLIIYILAIVVLQTFSVAANFYVATNGSSGGNGSEISPWDIETGFDTMDEGDTLYIKGGTYFPTKTLKVHAAYIGSLPANEWSLTTTVKNFDGTEVIIDGTNIVWASPGDGTYIQGIISASGGRSHVVIDGLTLRNTGESEGMGIDAHYFTNNVTVKNCKIHHTQSSAIFFSGGTGHIADNNEIYDYTYKGNHEGISAMAADNVTISNNYIHDIGNENSHNNGIAIDLKNGGSGHKVFGNKIHNSKIVGIYIDARGAPSDIEIYDNEIYNVDANPFPTNHGIVIANELPDGVEAITNVLVYNNVLYNIGTNGIAIGWAGHDGEVLNNSHFVNNTIYDTTYGISLYTTSVDGTTPNPSTGIYISNNIIYNQSGLSISHSGIVNYASYVVDTNVMNGSPVGLTVTNPLNIDPLFVDPANNNFKLQNTSPAIGAGLTDVSVYEPTTDYDGNARVIGSGIDIGAFEAILSATATGKTSIRSGFSLDMLTDFLGD